GASVAAHDPLRLPVLGIIVPDMGMRAGKRVSEAAALYASASLSDALFTGTQQRVLSLLFGQPGRAMSVSELIQATGAGSGAVQREIARLAGSGLLVSEQVGIVRKTFGLVAPLQEALAPLASRIKAAFVYGSVAKGSDTAASDIDLFLVSDELTYADVVGALHPLIEQLGRDINPTIYS